MARKVNFNAATNNMNTEKRKEIGHSTTSAYLSPQAVEYFGGMDNVPLPIKQIELYKIKTRDINSYHMIDNIELEESIKQYGMINPIAVFHKEGEEIYTISAGERRFQAMCRLHKQYPDIEMYKTIDCRVYILTEDPILVKQGFPYINTEMEEGIYRDSNNLARQLTDKDIASQIRYIVKRFDDKDYVQKLKETAERAGFRTYSSPDRVVLISSVMQSMGLWKREKIRQYLVVYDTKNEELLDAIEKGKITVYAAYKQIVDSKKRKRKRRTNKVTSTIKAIDELVVESKIQNYTQQDIEKLQECADKILDIIKKNSVAK